MRRPACVRPPVSKSIHAARLWCPAVHVAMVGWAGRGGDVGKVRRCREGVGRAPKVYSLCPRPPDQFSPSPLRPTAKAVKPRPHSRTAPHRRTGDLATSSPNPQLPQPHQSQIALPSPSQKATNARQLLVAQAAHNSPCVHSAGRARKYNATFPMREVG